MSFSSRRRLSAAIGCIALLFLCAPSLQAERRGPDPNAVAVAESVAATGTDQLNPDAVALVEDVESLLEPEKARGTFDRLSRLGAGAVPAIREMMRRQNLRLVRAGLDLSERLGNGARDARADLAAVVSDRKLGALRVRAARILGTLGDKAADALPQLAKSLGDPSERVREAVARAYLDIASQSDRWTPAVRQLLGSKGRWREQAVSLLVTYGPLIHPALPALAKLAEKKPATAGEAAVILVPQLVPGLSGLAKAAGVFMSTPEGAHEKIGANDAARDAAARQADEAASFEDVAASD
ncbi:MAG TPA: HEAT repeat domain-containing protein [Candidatus Ozemobacteraceae bacterium]|nr:HEAT repeat domain-containing protein [Candidatus Ozemobacteraceae bacterium]HQG28190.1 HEAT repeat domain-containing protein [Candidatus Ozemobacteraceae bacterium]